jgi:alpha-tubulin suppressor-like RCC1 family protein
VPLAVSLPARAIYVGIGWESSHAVGENNRVYSWGRNTKGQLGSGSLEPEFTFEPQEVKFSGQLGLQPLENVIAVFRSDGSDQCAQVQNPVEYGAGYVCWGGNDYGELGFGELPTKGEKFPAARPATAVPPGGVGMSHGEDHGCVVVPKDADTPGTYDDVWCWGRKEYVGDGTDPPDDPSITLPPQLTATRVLWRPDP